MLVVRVVIVFFALLIAVIRKDGTQKALIADMQTREELYDILNYHTYEKKLDELFSRGRS